MRRGTRTLSIVAFILILTLAQVASLEFIAMQRAANNHKWCAVLTLLVSHPVPLPANPGRHPAQEEQYQLYQDFLHLKGDLGC